MSLISEALRRARIEAARQEAERKGIPYRAAPSHVPVSRGIPLRSVLGLLAIGFLFSIGLGITIYRFTAPASGPTSQQVADSPQPEASAPRPPAVAEDQPRTLPEVRQPEDPAQPLATDSIEQPPTGSSVPTAPAPAVEAAVPPVQEPVPTPPAVSPTPRRESASEPIRSRSRTPEESPEPEPPQSQPTVEEAPGRAEADSDSARTEEKIEVQEYLREAVLADGKKLDLGGIAWSDTGPFALINGNVLGRGERVDGFLIVEINPKSVLLEGDNQSILLRLR